MRAGSPSCFGWGGTVWFTRNRCLVRTAAPFSLGASSYKASFSSIRGILRGYGLKVGEVSRGRFEVRIRELIAGHVTLETVIGAMLVARMALWNEFTKLHREMLKIARADKICRRLMSTPGVGALVALTYRSATPCHR